MLVLQYQQILRVPLRNKQGERLVMVAKSLGEDEERHGSVSFDLDQYFGVDSIEPI